MASCDMCGKEGILYKTEIEGTTLDVCKECAKYGKVIKQVLTKEEEQRAEQVRMRQLSRPIRVQKPQVEELIVEDYAKLVKDAREKLGLKQSELAIKIAEKESVLHSIESGKHEPNIALAKKLQRFLHIKLVETNDYKPVESTKPSDESLTLGDVIKIKKR